MNTTVRWTTGEIGRLRRHLAAAHEKHPEAECKAVAEVADEFGVSSAQIREVIARADRQQQADDAVYARDTHATDTSADLYHAERNALLERWSRGLAGLPTRRDPREGSASTVPRMLTPAHEAAAELSFARRRIMDELGRLVPDASDPGPEITECIIYRRLVGEGKIVRLLTRALRDMTPMLARAPYIRVHYIASAMLREITHGREEQFPSAWRAGKPKEIQQARRVWDCGTALAIRLLWASASQTARRAIETR